MLPESSTARKLRTRVQSKASSSGVGGGSLLQNRISQLPRPTLAANTDKALWSVANAHFFTGIRVAAQDSPANVHAVVTRAIVTSFGVFLVNGNASDFLLFVEH